MGFVFGSNLEEVVLLRKGKTLHVGCWNGIGGKLDGDETPVASMVRECREETLLSVSEHLWEEVGTIGFPNGNRVHVFATWMPNITSRLPVESSGFGALPNDRPFVIPIGKVGELPLAPHAEILIYAATQKLRVPDRAPVHIQEVARF